MKFFALTLYLTAFALAVNAATLNEAQVFEWWDDGIIDSDEAREILDLLEEGNTQEACILAEVYALENCTTDETPQPKKQQTKKPSTKRQVRKSERPSIVPHGFAEWRGRTDSLGHLESQRAEIRINFYRYSLRLGSQSLLTYRNKGSEAHFGQVSTKEIHSTIPTDTLWGSALLYPLGAFKAGALLDTAMTTRLSMNFSPNKDLDLQLAYWNHTHPTDSVEHRSFSAQAKGRWGSFAAWWIPENKGDLPLMKLQLQHKEKMEFASLTWKTDAYVHGETLPQEAHLAATIVKSRFWGSQTIGVATFDPWKSKLTVNARTLIPLEGDSSKTRFKATAEWGPNVLRSATSVTCLQAEDHCRQKDLALNAQSSWSIDRKQLIFSGKVRARHTRDEGFGLPRYEAGVTYGVDAFNKASIAVTVPKGMPSRELQLRSSAEVGNDFLQLSMAVTFRRTRDEALHPLHAAIRGKVWF